jgi:2-dehydropantoate 2-reductase
MSRPKVAIIGIGGVGGYIASKLIASDMVDTTLISRGHSLQAIKQNGLTIIDVDQEYHYDDITITDNPVGKIFDIVLLCTKSYDFESAIGSIKESITKDTLIIPLSNGMGHKDTLSRLLPNAHILSGCVYIVSHVVSTGVIKRVTDTFYMVFGDNIITDTMQEFADILNSSGLKSKLTIDVEYNCWKKYLFISSMATATSYYKAPMGYIANEKLDEYTALLQEIKGKIRQKQMEMVRQRMMSDVPKADVVVTNPTHYAIAIRYQEGVDMAPIVLAKGTDALAQKIKEIARENNVPIYENKPLARDLYKNVEIQESVPERLWQAVAEVLAYVRSTNRR